MKEVALFCALAVPAIATAQDAGHWYITPQLGGIAVDDDRPLQDKDWLYGLSIGRHLNDALSLELNANGAQIGGGPGRADLSLYGGSLDLIAALNRSGRVAPYFTVGAGVVQNERSPGTNATDFMTQAGLGMIMKLWESGDRSSSFSLRPEIKARWDDAGRDEHLLDYIGTLGFQFAFGAPERRAEPAPPPAPAPAPEPTPPPAPQPPPDTDRDGVTDNLDRCPDTPSGVAVDAYGCPRKGSITLEGVSFEHDSNRLTSDARNVLASVAADLKKFPRLRVELQGHTDSSGSDRYNLNLSQQRAVAVLDYLVEQGVPSGQLVAKGYGETQPVADNTTEAGRATNRRVVMFVVDNPGDVDVSGEGAVER